MKSDFCERCLGIMKALNFKQLVLGAVLLVSGRSVFAENAVERSLSDDQATEVFDPRGESIARAEEVCVEDLLSSEDSSLQDGDSEEIGKAFFEVIEKLSEMGCRVEALEEACLESALDRGGRKKRSEELGEVLASAVEAVEAVVESSEITLPEPTVNDDQNEDGLDDVAPVVKSGKWTKVGRALLKKAPGAIAGVAARKVSGSLPLPKLGDDSKKDALKDVSQAAASNFVDFIMDWRGYADYDDELEGLSAAEKKMVDALAGSVERGVEISADADQGKALSNLKEKYLESIIVQKAIAKSIQAFLKTEKGQDVPLPVICDWVAKYVVSNLAVSELFGGRFKAASTKTAGKALGKFGTNYGVDFVENKALENESVSNFMDSRNKRLKSFLDSAIRAIVGQYAAFVVKKVSSSGVSKADV